MSTPKQLAGEIVTRLLREFPDAPTKTLAQKAYKENPALWTSVEAARTLIRYYRGALGEAKRQYCADKTMFREPQQPGDPFAAIPVGLSHFEDWKSFDIRGDYKAAILSDIHIPYHDNRALLPALRHAKDEGCNLILLNGDLCDFFSISFWEKDPSKRNFGKEIETIKAFLETLRGAFPHGRIILKEGNHEERYERYMRVKAPELLSIKAFDLSALLTLDKWGVELVGDKRPIMLGDLNGIHGHEYRFAISGPVNPARGFFNRSKAHCIGGHFHHTSQHSEKNIEQKVISTWSTGCLCDMHPDYAPLNNWNHGFATVETVSSGAFQVHNHRIIDGKVY